MTVRERLRTTGQALTNVMPRRSLDRPSVPRLKGFEGLNGLVKAAADHLVGEQAEPAFYLVDPA
jgi:hypothetical protein